MNSMALHRCVHRQTCKLIFPERRLSSLVVANQLVGRRARLSECENDQQQTNRILSNHHLNQPNDPLAFSKTFSRRTFSSSPAKVNPATKTMSSPETDQQLTGEQADDRFLKAPARLLLRKPKNEDIVYLKLQYKLKLVHNDKYEIKHKVFSFQRNTNEPLIATFERLKLNVAQFVLQLKQKSKKKKPANQSVGDWIVNDSQPGSLLDVQFIHKNQMNLLEQSDFKLGDLLKCDEADLKLIINGVPYAVHFNSQFISSCKLPRVLLNDYEVLPSVQIDFSGANLEPHYSWWKKIDKQHPKYYELKKAGKLRADYQGALLQLGDQLTYTPSKEDVGSELIFKATARLNEHEDLETHEVKSKKVVRSPDFCPFQTRHEQTKNKTQSADEFRLVSYNILADMYSDSKTAREELFKHCPAQYLTMDYRKHLLLKELLGYNADLICLQEVDVNVFDKHLVPAFSLKTSLAGLLSRKGDLHEGCAIFYDQTRFRLVEQADLRISDLVKKECFAELDKQINSNFQLKGRWTVRPNVLQVAALECLDGTEQTDKRRLVLVFNTHFYFHPDSDHIRLLQACMIMKEIEDQVAKYSGLYDSVTPVVAGDFNSCPEFGVYKLFTEGRVADDLEDWRSCQSEFIENFSFESQFKFVSAYGRPRYTNYTEMFNGCLDYVFFNPDRLECKEIVPLIPHEQVTANRALPCVNIPSDHLALVCTLKFRETQSES